MSAIKSKNTLPEKILSNNLKKAGFPHRMHYGKHKIDIAFPKKKVAIFVDGCFWHQCPWHSHLPKSNKRYWVPKLKRNVERDKRKNNAIKKEGWKVVRVWEHSLKNMPKVIERISKELK
ncbi:MAG: very short patch repair endonuclease [Candidatus Aenigmarchaeota archaeon]|nr:very short patch repair endonuclease [Candidatus Aenigmarchaeota archaeon]